MPLAAEQFQTRGRPGRGCGVARILNALPDKDRAVLEAALSDPDVQHARITSVLRDEGYDIGQSVGRHRRGECSCGS